MHLQKNQNSIFQDILIRNTRLHLIYKFKSFKKMHDKVDSSELNL